MDTAFHYNNPVGQPLAPPKALEEAHLACALGGPLLARADVVAALEDAMDAHRRKAAAAGTMAVILHGATGTYSIPLTGRVLSEAFALTGRTLAEPLIDAYNYRISTGAAAVLLRDLRQDTKVQAAA